jgi:hypothetical protein
MSHRDCYDANGPWVYHALRGIFPTSLSQVFTLASNTWMSGDGQLHSLDPELDNYAKRDRITNVASTSFHVYA